MLRSTWDLSSPTRDQTPVPCIGRWILNHCATREVPTASLKRTGTGVPGDILTISIQVPGKKFDQLFSGGNCKIREPLRVNNPQFLVSLFVHLSFFNKFIYLFLAVLGLRFCVRAFSSCGKRGPVFIAVRGPLSRPLLLRSTGSRCAGSVVVAHGPSCSVACGIFPDQGSNPCPQH